MGACGLGTAAATYACKRNFPASTDKLAVGWIHGLRYIPHAIVADIVVTLGIIEVLMIYLVLVTSQDVSSHSMKAVCAVTQSAIQKHLPTQCVWYMTLTKRIEYQRPKTAVLLLS